MSATQSDSDDDVPRLSAHTLAALQEFYAETTDVSTSDTTSGTPVVAEDWQLSQFWYDTTTTMALRDEALAVCTDDTMSIACVSTPTAFAALHAAVVAGEADGKSMPNVRLLEFDRRFERQYGDRFVFYDYNKPLDVPNEIRIVEKLNVRSIFAHHPRVARRCVEQEIAHGVKCSGVAQ